MKLSVVTPSLNQGRFIERAIRSVLEQGYENVEYIVVDGGSSDETVDVIRRYEDDIDWWISEPDEGQTHALAKGFDRATGDVLAYLCSDDYYLPGAFEAAMDTLESSKATWAAGIAIHVDEHGKPRDTPVGTTWVPRPPDADPFRPPGPHGLVAYPWCVAQPASFWRRELFERYGGFRRDMHFGFDVEFMTRLAIEGELPALIEKELAASVLHSAAKSADPSKWDSEYKLMRKLHRSRLSWAERARLRLMGLNRPPRQVANRLVKLGGDLLEYVPEPVRPKIRTRDRRPSEP